MKKNWQGQRVIVIGAARQGLALARYLARHGARVLLNDKRSPEQMQNEISMLADTGIEWNLGGHPLGLLTPAPDLVCISGGVPLSNPLVAAAMKMGIPLSNDTQLFMEAVPCRTIGITGSAGKTTTTTLVGRIAQKDTSGRYRRVWVGGNIGDPLINYVDEMDTTDLAVLEISSFQAELMKTSPNVAAILNITPNHLDRHGSMESYIHAKAQVVAHQSANDTAVLGREDANAWAMGTSVKGHLLSFGLGKLPKNGDGSYREDGRFYLRVKGAVLPLPIEDVFQLRGEHNQQNVLAACTITHAIGLSPEAMRTGIEGFHGVPHRLELVSTWRGANWYNDSIATAPERTMAAIQAVTGPLVLLLGGRDKDLPWEALGDLVRKRVDHVIVFGEAADKILVGLGQPRPYSLERVSNCREAVMAAARVVEAGDSVLFSPGGTSYDEFKDFEERGERFKQWLQEFSGIQQ